jgi:hypothetical protein
VDSLGRAYVTGRTESTDFPTQNPYQTNQPFGDAFVTKLSPSGSSLVYSTYLGGNNDIEEGNGIAVDGAGSAYVTGLTDSTNFPTQNPYQTYQCCWADAFVTKLSPSGSSLAYSTYLGGKGSDGGTGIAVDSLGNAYVIGSTSSTDFPTQNPYQTYQGSQDVFVTKLISSTNLFTLAPCRLVDTRDTAGPFGGPALAAGADRIFTVVGRCGLPLTARAVSVNIAVTAPTATGNLRLYPAGTALPTVSSINYAASQTRANNAIVSLNTSGALTVRCTQASGTVHLILDANGYFE